MIDNTYTEITLSHTQQSHCHNSALATWWCNTCLWTHACMHYDVIEDYFLLRDLHVYLL